MAKAPSNSCAARMRKKSVKILLTALHTCMHRSITPSSPSVIVKAMLCLGHLPVVKVSKVRANLHLLLHRWPLKWQAVPLLEQGIKNLDVEIKGLAHGREVYCAHWRLLIRITSISDVTPVPHNGCVRKSAVVSDLIRFLLKPTAVQFS